jgi:hypothetical protein
MDFFKDKFTLFQDKISLIGLPPDNATIMKIEMKNTKFSFKKSNLALNYNYSVGL